MSMRSSSSHARSLLFLVCVLAPVCGGALAATVTPLSAFPTPAPGSYVVAGAALGDGRYLAWNGDTVQIETATGSGIFQPVAEGYAGDPGFAAVASDGHTVILGGGFNGNLYRFDASQPQDFTPASIAANRLHFTGTFLTETLVLVDAGKLDFTGSELAIVDLTNAKRDVSVVVRKAARYWRTKEVVVDKPPFSYSSAVTVDSARGVVYAMDGNTRELRAFAVDALVQAHESGATLDWETDGALIGQPGLYYTGGVSGITAGGLLVVGGSEGYLLPGGIQFVEPGSGNVAALLDPTGSRSFYTVVFNPAEQTLIAMVEGAYLGEAYLVDLACADNPDGCGQPRGGFYETGDDLCLSIPCPVAFGSTFDWRKDGAPLSDDGRVSGTGTSTLHVMALEVADSGVYTCVYDDGAKSTRTFAARVEVGEQTPATNAAGLAALALATAYAGVSRLRRARQDTGAAECIAQVTRG